MEKAHWLQTGATISNPYFGAAMATCGSIVDGNAQPAPMGRSCCN
jgi:hypothetical protein